MESICLDWRLELEQYWLRDEDLSSFRTQIADFGFEKLNLLARSTTPHLQEPIYDGVKVHIILIRHFLLPMIRGGYRFNNPRATVTLTLLVLLRLIWF